MGAAFFITTRALGFMPTILSLVLIFYPSLIRNTQVICQSRTKPAESGPLFWWPIECDSRTGAFGVGIPLSRGMGVPPYPCADGVSVYFIGFCIVFVFVYDFFSFRPFVELCGTLKDIRLAVGDCLCLVSPTSALGTKAVSDITIGSMASSFAFRTTEQLSCRFSALYCTLLSLDNSVFSLLLINN